MTSRAERIRQERQIPGTYAYADAHGLGKAGAKKRVRQRRYRSTAKGLLKGMRSNAKRRGEISDGS